jgi:serine/threonine protein kinase
MENLLKSLPDGFQVADFKLVKVIGQGGFGITYLAIDLNLDQEVAIKEYYPREFANRDSTHTIHAVGNLQDKETFQWGLSRFLEEARILAKLNHPNVVAVKQFFQANGTAYLVMEYCVGKPLDEIIRDHGPLNNEELVPILDSLLDGVEHVHSNDFLHRDIKPANIFIRENGSPVLLDFGAAKSEMTSHSRSVTSLATAGYAPFEQYSTKGKQGPWSDVYGLAATLYRTITGIKPQDAPDRILEDQVVQCEKLLDGKFNRNLLFAIDKAMSVRPENRPQSISEFKKLIYSTSNSFDKQKSKTNYVESGNFEPKNKTIKIFAGLILILAVAGIVNLIVRPLPPSSPTLPESKTASVSKLSEPVLDSKKPNIDSNESSRASSTQITPALSSKPIEQVIKPKTVDEIALIEFQKAFKEGQLIDAEQILKKAINISSNNPKLYFEMAQLLVNQKRYAEASVFITKAKTIDSSLSFVSNKDRFISVLDEITSFEKKNQYDDQKNLELNTSIYAILDEGEQCYARKKFDCAISSANNVLRLRSDNERAMLLKTRAQNAQKAALDSISVN